MLNAAKPYVVIMLQVQVLIPQHEDKTNCLLTRENFSAAALWFEIGNSDPALIEGTFQLRAKEASLRLWRRCCTDSYSGVLASHTANAAAFVDGLHRLCTGLLLLFTAYLEEAMQT